MTGYHDKNARLSNITHTVYFGYSEKSSQKRSQQVSLNLSPYIDIVLIFFPYSGPSGILGSDGKAEYHLSRCYGAWELLHFPLVLMNRLNETESADFLNCRFSLFLKDLFFQIICVTLLLSTKLTFKLMDKKSHIFTPPWPITSCIKRSVYIMRYLKTSFKKEVYHHHITISFIIVHII